VLCDGLVTISTNEDLLSEAGQTTDKKYLGDEPAFWLGNAYTTEKCRITPKIGSPE